MFNIEKYNEIRDFLRKKSQITEIIAVSKNHSQEKVIEAIKSGIYIFGENRVIEAKDKFFALKKQHPNIELHLTGPLQSNKVKTAISLFDVFHTLDREKIAKEFSKYHSEIVKKKIFVQVNTGKEKTKSGIFPEDLKKFIVFCIYDLKLNIHGLMCIPPINEEAKEHFAYLRYLANENNISNLSIGMSNDYKIAAEFKPSYVRLGTILFGERLYK